jgi:hypothetical protein
MVVVGEGLFAPDLRWVIEADGTEDDFMTMLTVRRGDQIVSSGGMGGPKLHADDLVNASYGVTDDQPCTEVIRAHPSVDKVVVVTDRGSEIPAALGMSDDFGLRFGALQLPAGHLPVELRAESSGTTVYQETQGGLRGFDPTTVSDDGIFYGGAPD